VFNVLGAVGALLANPIVAGLLGLGLGIGLLLFSRASARMMTPDEPEIGFARVAVALVLRMAFAVVTLLGFYLWIRPGLVPFGVGLVAGFFVMIVVELFSLGGRSAPSVR
jgi:membrane-associated phospholipid phosphatase